MNLHFDTSTPVGDIVAADYRAAAILERFGIDFCCGGRQTFGDACLLRKMDPSAVAAELATLPAASTAEDAPDRSWPLATLADHIVSRHHAYVRRQLPVIAAHLDRLVGVHGQRHPELRQIAAHFRELSGELLSHMTKEEEILFPYVQQLAASATGDSPAPEAFFGTVRNPIRMMEAEHRYAGDELGLIRGLSSNYLVPPDGCTTYRVCFEELAAFDADLRQHIHLENNILFPRAVSLEAAVDDPS